MKIVYHLGAHESDDGLLLRCLEQNRAVLERHGTAVLGEADCQALIHEALNAEQSQPSEGAFLPQALKRSGWESEENPKRLIVSAPELLCPVQEAFHQGQLYPSAGERTRALAALFPENPAVFFCALRNPATFLPALLAKNPEKSYEALIQDTDPRELFWSDMVSDVLEHNPQTPMVVWCDEDTPLISRGLLYSLAGCPPKAPLEGTRAILARLVPPEKLAEIEGDLEACAHIRPPRRRRQIFARLLHEHIPPENVEMEIDIPSWTQELVDELTALYHKDVEAIAANERVHFIRP